MEIMAKLESRRIAKIKLNKLRNEGVIVNPNNKEHKKLLDDASFVIPDKRKGNPFKIPFKVNGSIDFELLKQTNKEKESRGMI